MNRHASLDQLARLGADDLRPRKAARIGRHLASCAQCTRVSDQLAGVPALLSSVSFPQMPQNLSDRIDSVLAAESAQRVAAEPASEAGRRELPARSAAPGRLRAGRAGSGGLRPSGSSRRLPVPATRVLATAAAILVVGVSGYEIATHAGAGVSSNSAGSASGARVPAPAAAPASLGPQVSYRQAGTENSIRMVTSDTNFRAATFADQAAAAVREAKVEGVRATPGPTSVNSGLSTSSAKSSGTVGSADGATRAGSQLSGCIDHVVTSGQVVIMVESARFEGARATIIVTVPTWARSTDPPKDAEVWAVGEACSATDSNVLDHVRVARL
jgi:hypothetical protein